VFVRVVSQRQVEALRQPVPSLDGVIVGRQRGANVVQRVDFGLTIAY
jgi:hypothetical protein